MRKAILRLVILIIVVSSLCAITGIFSSSGNGGRLYHTIHNETVEIYGTGIYRNDSITLASQAIAQDIVTILLGVPLLIISLVLSKKTLKGLFLLTGTLGYFLYTYMSYSFLVMYNILFLFYVILMSSSLFAFIFCIILIAKHYMKDCFQDNFNSKFIGGFMLFLALALCFMWLGRIVPPLFNHSMPFGLEHYSTLVIQAMDIGLIIPTAFLAGIFTLQKKPLGYFLSSLIVIKGTSLLTAVNTMTIVMSMNGIETSFVEMALFTLFNVVAIFSLVMIIRKIKEPSNYRKRELET